jgi:hypothetical protein
MESFNFNKNKNILKVKGLNLKILKKIFKTDLAYINTETNKLFGKDIEINLNNKSFNKDNEPRLKGKVLVMIKFYRNYKRSFYNL